MRVPETEKTLIDYRTLIERDGAGGLAGAARPDRWWTVDGDDRFDRFLTVPGRAFSGSSGCGRSIARCWWPARTSRWL